MSFLTAWLGWATVLGVPCWLASGAYQALLGRVAAMVLAVGGVSVEFQEIQLMAPLDLALFVGLCLASRRAPPRRRLAAIYKGVPILVGIEVLAVLAAVAPVLMFRAGELQAAATRLAGSVIETVPWVSAGVVWLLLLGSAEFRHVAPAQSSGAKVGSDRRAALGNSAAE